MNAEFMRAENFIERVANYLNLINSEGITKFKASALDSSIQSLIRARSHMYMGRYLDSDQKDIDTGIPQ